MSKYRVLIVDDDPFNQEVLQIRLEMLKCEVVVLEDGEDAVAFIKSGEKVTLIYMDINMVRLDGDKATELIRAYEKEMGLERTPIIATGASIYKQDEERLLACGMDEIIIKPIEQDDLESTVQRYVFMEDTFSYDIEKASATLNLSVEKILPLLKKFTLTLDEEVSTLIVYADQKDFESLRLLAHKLKGRAGNFQVSAMFDIFSKIENAAKESHMIEYKALADEVMLLNEKLKEL